MGICLRVPAWHVPELHYRTESKDVSSRKNSFECLLSFMCSPTISCPNFNIGRCARSQHKNVFCAFDFSILAKQTEFVCMCVCVCVCVCVW